VVQKRPETWPQVYGVCKHSNHNFVIDTRGVGTIGVFLIVITSLNN